MIDVIFLVLTVALVIVATLAALATTSASPTVRVTANKVVNGSAAAFVTAIDQAGIVSLHAYRRYIQVLKPVRVAKGDSYGELRPHARGLRIEAEIEFDHPLIGRQSCAVDVDPDVLYVDNGQILTSVWGPAHKDDTQYLRVFIGQLRAKIESDPAAPTIIRTEAGIGYRFSEG